MGLDSPITRLKGLRGSLMTWAGCRFWMMLSWTSDIGLFGSFPCIYYLQRTTTFHDHDIISYSMYIFAFKLIGTYNKQAATF